jgi:hypothetical protein
LWKYPDARYLPYLEKDGKIKREGWIHDLGEITNSKRYFMTEIKFIEIKEKYTKYGNNRLHLELYPSKIRLRGLQSLLLPLVKPQMDIKELVTEPLNPEWSNYVSMYDSKKEKIMVNTKNWRPLFNLSS